LKTVSPATENAGRANSVRTRGTNSRGAPAERIGPAGAATVDMSCRYGGVNVVSTLWVSTAVLTVMRCFTGSMQFTIQFTDISVVAYYLSHPVCNYIVGGVAQWLVDLGIWLCSRSVCDITAPLQLQLPLVASVMPFYL